MPEIGRWLRQCNRLSMVVPLTALALLSAGWSNPLRPPLEGLDARVLQEDSRYMRGLHDAGNGEAVRIDLTDARQYRFVMNRLKASGKTAANAPHLFARLEALRRRSLERGTAAAAPLSAEWGCEHEVTMVPGPISGDRRGYALGAASSCQNGANYMSLDLVVYESDLGGDGLTPVTSEATEEYSGGTNLTLEVKTYLSLSATRQPVVDSMMIAMDDMSGEEVVSYVRGASGSTLDPARLRVTHPSFAAEEKPNITLCQLRGGDDCDYAVVSDVNGTLQPWEGSPIGVAQRLTQAPWTGNPNALFPFNNGSGFDEQHVFVPARFIFDAGRGAQACVIKTIKPLTRARLVKNIQGGQCGTTEDLTSFLQTGARLTSLNRLLNLSRNTTVPTRGNADCDMARITNEVTDYSLTISVEADCGQGPETRMVTFRSKPDGKWNLHVLNSCIAAGTPVERADGTFVPVEDVRVGDRLATGGDGQALTVTQVQRGLEDQPLYQLRDDQGHEVRLTKEHPVLLESGKVVKAEAVKVEDRVRTRTGVAAIVSVTRVKHEGQVYNFTLGTPEELAKAPQASRTLYAGGFQVGDSSMQQELTAPRLASTDVLTRLPKMWRQDFQRRPVLPKK